MNYYDKQEESWYNIDAHKISKLSEHDAEVHNENTVVAVLKRIDAPSNQIIPVENATRTHSVKPQTESETKKQSSRWYTVETKEQSSRWYTGGEWPVPDNQTQQTNTRRQECPSWNLYGTCKFGNKCSLEHVESDSNRLSIRKGSSAYDKTQLYGTKEVKECWYYRNSSCKFGSRCHNVHTSSKMEAYQAQPVIYVEKSNYKPPDNHSDNFQHKQKTNYKKVSNRAQSVTFIRKLDHLQPVTTAERHPHYAQSQTANSQPHHQFMQPVTSTENHYNQPQTGSQGPHYPPTQTVVSTEAYLHEQSQTTTRKPRHEAAWQLPASINNSSKLKQRRPTQTNILCQPQHYTVKHPIIETIQDYRREQSNSDSWRWEPESLSSRDKRNSNNSTYSSAKTSSYSTIGNCPKINDEETPQQETMYEDGDNNVIYNRNENYGNDIDERNMPWSSHSRNSPFFQQGKDQPDERVNSKTTSRPQVNFNNLIDVQEDSNYSNVSKQKRRKKTD